MKIMEPQNVPSQPQSTEPVLPKPNRLFLLPLIIGGILVLITSFFGGLYLAKRQLPPLSVVNTLPTVIPSLIPTPLIQDETKNWKTYSNTKYSFSFKYPDSYFTDQSPYDSGIVLRPGNEIEPEANKSGFQLAAAYNSYIRQSSLDEFLSSKENRESNVRIKIPMNIGSIVGYKIVYDYFNPLSNKTSYVYEGLVLKNRKLYTITLVSWNQSFLKKLETTFDQILSTFKFINETGSVQCTDENIMALIIGFESRQIQRDAKGVLALFTPPVTQEDILQYNNLSYQFPSSNNYRLYGTLSWGGGKEQSFQITSRPATNNNKGGCTVNVTEMVKGYSNAGSSVGETPAQPRNTMVDVVSQNGVWKIDKYYLSDQTKKYSAFGSY